MTPKATVSPEELRELFEIATSVADMLAQCAAKWYLPPLFGFTASTAPLVVKDAIDKANAALDAYREAAVMAERDWRPIEDAPKDGTWILAWRPSTSLPIVVRWAKFYRNTEDWGWRGDNDLPYLVTHWTALPVPPGAEAVLKEGE